MTEESSKHVFFWLVLIIFLKSDTKFFLQANEWPSQHKSGTEKIVVQHFLNDLVIYTLFFLTYKHLICTLSIHE